MKMRKRLCIIIAVLTLCLVTYTFWDNQRIIVRTQNVFIDQLPEAFDGYSILQISDLRSHPWRTNFSAPDWCRLYSGGILAQERIFS